MVKSVSKVKLDNIIRLARKSAKTHDMDIYCLLLNDSDKLIDGDTFAGGSIREIVHALVGHVGLRQNATNADIYKVFNAIGIEVVDDTEAHDEQSA